MAVAKKKTYSVTMKVIVITDIDIRAESMEEALAEAKKLGVKDVVEFDSGYVDGSIDVASVSDPAKWID